MTAVVRDGGGIIGAEWFLSILKGVHCGYLMVGGQLLSTDSIPSDLHYAKSRFSHTLEIVSE